MTELKICIGVDWAARRLCIEDHAEPRAQLEVHFNYFNAVRGISPMATTITDTQEVTVAVSFQDKRGNPAVIDGAPTWANNNDDVATVEASEDGYSATILANGPTGHTQVMVTADSQIGDGVTTITGILELDVVASEAVTANITAGAPEEQIL